MLTLAYTCAAWLAANPSLDAARKQVSELHYPQALPLLKKARAVDGLDRTSLLEILWLQGLVNATLGKKDEARDAFRALLLIDVDFKVPSEQPPKVMGPFFEAKG